MEWVIIKGLEWLHFQEMQLFHFHFCLSSKRASTLKGKTYENPYKKKIASRGDNPFNQEWAPFEEIRDSAK